MSSATSERTSRNWIQTVSGRQFWPLNPRAEDICIEDIAHALSMKCRYTGHCREFYSVAQHSVLVSHFVPADDQLWGLLHDATEAYLPDVAKPVKRELVGFDAIEERLAECVAERFGLPWPMPDSIAYADLVLLSTERRDLMGPPPIPWLSTEGTAPLVKAIVALNPAEARAQFLHRFHELTNGGV